MYKKFLPLLMSLLILVLFAGCNEDVVATVNKEKITAAQLDKRVEAIKAEMEKYGMADFNSEDGQQYLEMIRQSALEEMINTRLTVQEARKSGKLTNEQIEAKINMVVGQNSSMEEFDSFLAEYDISREDYAYIIEMQERIAKEVPTVSEAEARKYYDENIDKYAHQEQLQVRHILFAAGGDGSDGITARHTDEEARQLAENVIAKMRDGGDFAALAITESEDSGTAQNGGLYTFSLDGGTVKEFSDAAAALAPGEYTQTPVKTQFGYHVIKMEKLIPPGHTPFDEIKQEIITELTENNIELKINEKMQEAKDKANIVNKIKPAEENIPDQGTTSQDTPAQDTPVQDTDTGVPTE